MILLLSSYVGLLSHLLRLEYGTFRLFAGDDSRKTGEMFVSGLSVYFAGAWKVAILLTDEAGFPRSWTCVVACRNVGVLHGRLAESTKGREGGA